MHLQTAVRPNLHTHSSGSSRIGADPDLSSEAHMYTSEGKKIVSTDKAPKAIGPYSQAVRIESLVFTAGQIGLDPVSLELVAGGIDAQTRQSLTNLKNVLEAAGSGLNYVVKTTVYLTDMNDFAGMNAIYAEYFPENPPARSTVGAAALPKGALVEIETVALLAAGRGD
jgi:2-iminobutanoate/2-iminopropanoate deaminase